MGISRGINGNIYIATGSPTSFTTEAMTANDAKTVFTIDADAKRFWDPATALTVKYDGSTVTDYASVQYPGGIVSWDTTPGDAAVTVSGKYIPVAALGTARSWSMDASWDFVDVTCFQDTMRVMEPTFLSGTAELEHFYVDSTLVAGPVTDASLVGFDLFVVYDAVTPANCIRYTGLGYISSLSISAAVDGIIEEPVSLTITDGPYLVSGLA